MSEENNPYAAPQAESIVSQQALVNAASFRVDGKFVSVTNPAELPNYCYITGEDIPDGARRKKTMFWASPWLALIILINLIIYIIVNLCVRKKVVVHFSLSAPEQKKLMIKKTISTLFCLGVLALTIFCFFLGVSNDIYFIYGFAGIFIFLFSVLIASNLSSVMRVKKCANGRFLLTGAGKPFLDRVTAENPQTTQFY